MKPVSPGEPRKGRRVLWVELCPAKTHMGSPSPQGDCSWRYDVREVIRAE